MPQFYIGQKVVCIFDYTEQKQILSDLGWEFEFPKLGNEYTIRKFWYESEKIMILLKEIPIIQEIVEPYDFAAFSIDHFRSKEFSGMKIFYEILNCCNNFNDYGKGI